MTRTRSSPYLHVTWIAKYLVGEKNCLWAAWFKSNHQGYAKVPSNFDSARWNMEHTDLLNELIAELEKQGCEIFIERQNEFRVLSARSGTVISGRPDIIAVHCDKSGVSEQRDDVISGRPDIIAVHPDGNAKIYDVKTGRLLDSHVAQVQLYMYLIPRAQLTRRRGVKFEGALVYPDGSEIAVPADSVDEAFIERVAKFIRTVTSNLPARRVPSVSECNWCDLTIEDCSDKMEQEVA